MPQEAKATVIDHLLRFARVLRPRPIRLIAIGVFLLVFLGSIIAILPNAGTEIVVTNQTNAELSTLPVWQQEIRQVFYPQQRNFQKLRLFAQIDTEQTHTADPRYDVRIFHLTEDREVYHAVLFLSDMTGFLDIQLPQPVFESAYSSLTLVITPLSPFPAAPALTLETIAHADNGASLTVDDVWQGNSSLSMQWIHRRSLRALWGLLLAVCVLGFAAVLLLNSDTHRNFIVIALAMGLVFCFANPMFGAYDECAHFVRAFDIAEGHLTVQRHPEGYGMQIPVNLYDYAVRRYHFREMALDRLMLNFDSPASETRVFNDFVVNCRTYTPLNYLPQVLGIWIGNLLNLSILWQGYIGRVLALLAYISLCAAAIRIIPQRKTTLMALALLPMLLLTGASLSQDAVMIGALFLFFAHSLKAISAPDGSLGWKQILLLLILPILAIFSKYVYVPFLLLALIIPSVKFQKRAVKYVLWLGLGLLVIGSAAWTLITTMQVSGVGMGGSMSELLRAPWNFLFAALYTISRDIGSWLLHWNDQPWLWGMESAVTIAGPVLLGLVVALDGQEPQTKRLRVTMPLGFMLVAGLVLLAGYMIWNQPGSGWYIGGIQGRYFLPALPLLLYAIPAIPAIPARRGFDIRKPAALACLILLTVNLVNGIANIY